MWVSPFRDLRINGYLLLPEEMCIRDRSMGYIGRVGMRSTDTEILNVMIDRADINQGC